MTAARGRGSHPAQKYIREINGPIAIGRSCTLCGFGVTKQKERRPGRGWGMREGNKLRGALIQHIKAEHPEFLEVDRSGSGGRARLGDSRES